MSRNTLTESARTMEWEIDAGISRSRRTRMAQLEDALRFYANPENHVGVGNSHVYNDRGRRARAALAPGTAIESQTKGHPVTTEASPPDRSQTDDSGSPSTVGGLSSDSPTVCDWCGERTALAGGCQNERCPSR